MGSTLVGKTYLITGATSGIGLAAAEELARRGANVLGVGHSAERCAEAEGRLVALEGGGQVWMGVADLSVQAEVRKLAGMVRERVAALDGLVNNAGTFTYRRAATREGFEMQWAVNHLAPFLLTRELLPLLQAPPFARVVTVSSGSHYHTHLRWNDLQLRRGYNGLLAYKQTKLCNVLFTAELNRRLGSDSTVRAFAADPGLVFTDMGFKGNPLLMRWVWARRRRGGIPPEESAQGVVFLAVEPSIQGSQEIYWKHGVVKAPNPYALDPDAARRLWEISAQMCGLPG
ncbi:MAG: SDR family NAD(P)-dependent oxidoreductase [Chloroflexi bacterium]|nr:SDR family NAD(P)-dependent oxidoreductase [Chloroflexota bacterium]